MPLLSSVVFASALLLPSSPAPRPVTRRAALGTAAGAAAALTVGVRGAHAEEPFSRMGGLLEPFVDVSKGYKIYKPSGWNEFPTDPGVYDIKWQDIIEQETTVQVSTSPVATATSINALGDLQAVGVKFSKSRSAELLSAKESDVDGSLVYTFELKGEQFHELLALTINRGKLYRVSAVTSNKKWDKRKELYRNIVASFVPRGY